MYSAPNTLPRRGYQEPLEGDTQGTSSNHYKDLLKSRHQMTDQGLLFLRVGAGVGILSSVAFLILFKMISNASLEVIRAPSIASRQILVMNTFNYLPTLCVARTLLSVVVVGGVYYSVHNKSDFDHGNAFFTHAFDPLMSGAMLIVLGGAYKAFSVTGFAQMARGVSLLAVLIEGVYLVWITGKAACCDCLCMSNESLRDGVNQSEKMKGELEEFFKNVQEQQLKHLDQMI